MGTNLSAVLLVDEGLGNSAFLTGAEKATNTLLRAQSEDAFALAVLTSLGSYPPYFRRLPELNRRGPALVGDAAVPTGLGAADAARLRAEVVDARAGHRRRRPGRRSRRLGPGHRREAAGGRMSSALGAGPARGPRPVTLGLRANAAQFTLLVAVNALVGGMLGQERTVLPLLATRTFHLARLHRRADLHPRVRRGQGGDQLRRRHLVGPVRPQAGAGGRLAGGGAGAVAADLGAVLGLDRRPRTSCSASARA